MRHKLLLKSISVKICLSSVLLLPLFFACASYQNFKYITEEFEMPSRIYRADYNQTWKAVIEIMNKFDLSLQNYESGVIKTRWIDNTNEINFAESFNKNEAIKAAKFKIILNVVKGFRKGKEVSKVTIYRRQLIEQDFLQGWKEIPSDGIQEKAILYRIKRLIVIDNKLRRIDRARQKESEESQQNEFSQKN